MKQKPKKKYTYPQAVLPTKFKRGTDMAALKARLDVVASKLGYESRNELLSTYILSL
jgi:hypothetical protein